MNTPILPGLTPRIDVLTVTPAIAREWLTRNTHNRRIRQWKVDAFARVMAAGDWQMNGDTVRFSTDNVILDGQHRLLAVVKANVALEMIIVTGLPPESQDTMDSGTKRTTADAFGLAGEQYAVNLAAVTRRVWAWKNGDHKLSMNVSPEITESKAFLAANPSIRRSSEIAIRTRRQYKFVSAALFGTAHFLFNEISSGEAAVFAARLGDGAGIPLGHPVLTLRARLLSDADKDKRVYDYVQLALYIRAWNAMRAGRTPTHFKPIAENDAMPMPQ